MSRASAIILKDNKVALIERRNGIHEHLYYIYPGGGVEKGETIEEATIREVEEETGLVVTIEKLIAEVIFRENVQYYYLTKIIGGKFGEGNGPEMRGLYDESHGTYNAIWMCVEDLLKNPVYPECVSRIIVDSFKKGWPKEIKKNKDNDKIARSN
ncbi:NUDIX domain-containing protein [Iocasia frigidifontis]|nr:NUDIX domain-containing protein [Iocasia fonsfrigidae]